MYWGYRKSRAVLIITALGMFVLLWRIKYGVDRSFLSHPQRSSTGVKLLRQNHSFTGGAAQPKLILLWNAFADLNLEVGSQMFQRFRCPQAKCSITRDRDLLPHSQVVMFHMRETVSPDQLPDLSKRPPGQKWIFAMKEPPVYSQFDAGIFNGFFDWTVTYKRDSDIAWPYGGFTKRPRPRKIPDYFALKTAPQYGQNQSSQATGNQRGSIGWIVSRCKSDTKRENFVLTLSQHIDVSIYGRCGRLQCSRGNATDACRHRIKDYHFYLAFENSFCPEYVTEKLYKALAVEDRPPIPVVMGLANYSLVAPPGSVIDVRDFASPAHLAIYLRKVMANRELYNSFHEWRRDYRVFEWGTPAAMCGLCSKAHAGPQSDDPPHRDLHVFWDKASCHR